MKGARALVAAVTMAAVVAPGVTRAADIAVVHERESRTAAEIVASDMLWGGVAGTAVGGIVMGFRMGIQNQQSYDWLPVLVTGLGIGLAGGLVLGIVDAMSRRPSDTVTRPVRDGMSWHDLGPADRSRQVTLPLYAGRF